MSQSSTELYVETISMVGNRPGRLGWHYEQPIDIALLEMGLDLVHGLESSQ